MIYKKNLNFSKNFNFPIKQTKLKKVSRIISFRKINTYKYHFLLVFYFFPISSNSDV